jgi:succinate dehydrogenase / fumarate reductase membrane anchor subunit
MKESTLWFLFILSGAVMVLLLAIHMAIMHMDSLLLFFHVGYDHVLSSESVARRAREIFHVIVYMLLLVTALFHGLYGLRSMIYELPLKEIYRKMTDVAVLLAGVLFFFWGAAAIIIGYVS